MTCTYVTERDTEGPCVALIDWARYVGLKCWGEPDDHCEDHGEGTCTIYHAHHAYLGPVVERCGHEAGDHRTSITGRMGCLECARALAAPENLNYDACFHAYTLAG